MVVGKVVDDSSLFHVNSYKISTCAAIVTGSGRRKWIPRAVICIVWRWYLSYTDFSIVLNVV